MVTLKNPQPPLAETICPVMSKMMAIPGVIAQGPLSLPDPGRSTVSLTLVEVPCKRERCQWWSETQVGCAPIHHIFVSAKQIDG